MIFSDLILFLLCLMGAGFFDGMETGLISLNRMRAASGRSRNRTACSGGS